jgi:hypothetical protein
VGDDSARLAFAAFVFPSAPATRPATLPASVTSWLYRPPGGKLAFMEQDLHTDSLNYPGNLVKKIFTKEARLYKHSQGLGLRKYLRQAGLSLLPRRSFLWTEEEYGPYLRDLLGRFLEANLANGSMTQAEVNEVKSTLQSLASEGDFFYSLNYHLIAGQKAPS